MRQQPPAIGTSHHHKERHYELMHVRKYARKDGGATFLLTWRTHCTVCAINFTVKTRLIKGVGHLTGRCPLHRRNNDHAAVKEKLMMAKRIMNRFVY